MGLRDGDYGSRSPYDKVLYLNSPFVCKSGVVSLFTRKNRLPLHVSIIILIVSQ